MMKNVLAIITFVRRSIIVICVLMALTPVAVAQLPCGSVLTLGVPNIDRTELDEVKRTDFISRLKQYRSYEEAKDSSFGLTFSIDGLLDDFDLTHDNAGYMKLIEQLERYERQSMDWRRRFRRYSQRASKVIANAFVKCLTDPRKAYAWAECVFRAKVNTDFVARAVPHFWCK